MSEDCLHLWKITTATQERVSRECILCHASDSFPATAERLLPRYIEAEEQHLLCSEHLAQAEDQCEEWLDQANLRELNIQDAWTPRWRSCGRMSSRWPRLARF